MRHSRASTLSKSTKRITLLMYIRIIPITNAATTTAATRAASSAILIPAIPGCHGGEDAPGWRGKVELKLKLPPEPSSPASNPTKASFTHWPRRNGLKSCCFVCSTASEIVSTAEIGKGAPRVLKAQKQGTAKSPAEQIKKPKSRS